MRGNRLMRMLLQLEAILESKPGMHVLRRTSSPWWLRLA